MRRTESKATIVGIAQGGEPGHTRLTRGKNFFLHGGDKETHGKLQEAAIKINEHCDREGVSLAEADRRDLHEVVDRVMEE